MFTVILFLFAGIAAGRLLRNRDCGWVSKLTTILIWSLLFLLGVGHIHRFHGNLSDATAW